MAEKRTPVPAGYMSSGQLCSYLGITPRTFRRRRKANKIPAPDHVNHAGWGYWSPDQQRMLLKREARLG